MAVQDAGRINTNLGALNALSSMKNVSKELSISQMRLQTGKRINSATDDPAGYAIVSKLNSRVKGLTTALDSVGTSANMFSISEGAAQTIVDNLTSIQDLARQANSGNLGSDERAAMALQIKDMTDEITRLQKTSFNGVNLLDGSFLAKQIITGSESTDTILVTLAQDFSLASLGVTVASLDISTTGAASVSVSRVDAALTSARIAVQTMGSISSRLSGIRDNLSTAITNSKAAVSRIEDADVAAEQVNVVRLQILQQLAMAQLSQANNGPQQVLQLFK